MNGKAIHHFNAIADVPGSSKAKLKVNETYIPYWGYAGTLPAFIGALTRQPGLCRGFTGINRSQSGLTGTLPGC
ncbi:hypothetical protein DPMN_081263 [Dreissena polymorpha]|uniref:Uncharacterized protein n=1 Tax=Dreissena polymorpha TaxID=45954 RepID=A0A9D3Y8L4_DREPO|nr:hypothetical protein DPMN_081263 [Dreissena polymorpha]